jgi:uncharacterized paraquat-inducible protein A
MFMEPIMQILLAFLVAVIILLLAANLLVIVAAAFGHRNTADRILAPFQQAISMLVIGDSGHRRF